MTRRYTVSAVILFCGVSAQAAPRETRTAETFAIWRQTEAAPTVKFEAFLVSEGLNNVVPIDQLLRTASDWKKCAARPYAVPPHSHWPSVRATLEIVRKLRDKKALEQIEVVSAYRDRELNRCANGSPQSAHYRAFAVDIVPQAPKENRSICAFWRTEGKELKMGLSRYASGRVHVDANGYRTWGSDFTRKTSFCVN